MRLRASPLRSVDRKIMNALSLYSGIGGIDLAAEWAGISTSAFCEMDSYCRTILSRHWPGVPIFQSDEEVTVAVLNDRDDVRKPIHLVFGGPPCQPFSQAGRRGGANRPTLPVA